jgi:asparagine synthase (glutamine-hydrolysing)
VTSAHFSGALSAPNRLAALDGEAIGGPPSAGCRCLFRGWVADAPALRRRLGLADEGGAEPGGAERLLAAAFREWGDRLQARVDGQFAAVVLDAAAGTALLTHDALGIAPLYWRERSGRLEFSTRLRDLVDARAAADLDDEYLADFLAFGVPSSRRTPYRAIRRLMPGTSLRWSGGRVTELRTWSASDVEPVRFRDNREYEERFEELVGSAVGGALDTGRPTWIALSGGTDSVTVAGAAARHGGGDLRAYSVVAPRWQESDESRWIRKTVDALGLPWQPIDAEDVLPFARMPTEFCGEPNQSIVNLGLIDTVQDVLGASGSRVLLTGKGGDGFAGASSGDVPAHLADALFEARPLTALRETLAWKAAADDVRSLSFWLRRGLIAPSLRHLGGRRARVHTQRLTAPWLRPDYERTLRVRARAQRSPSPRCRTPGRQMLLDELWLCSAQMEPAATIGHEVRHPLFHRPLFEFQWAIPWQQKLLPRCDRYLQRRALRGVVPDSVRRRVSSATGTRALVEGLRRSREWQDYLCERPRIAEHGIADAERWRTAIKQASVGQTHGDHLLVAGIAVEVWLKQLDEHGGGAG